MPPASHNSQTITQHTPQIMHLPSSFFIPAILTELKLPAPRPTVLLNGSTSSQQTTLYERVQSLIQDGLARWLVEQNASVITGGTDAGIFALLGQGFARWGRPAACIGIAVANLVRVPGATDQRIALEPNHSHFVLVPGTQWGDETETMYAIADNYAAPACSVALYVGGGPLTLNEMAANARTNRPMILIAGSGGAADAVLAAAGQQNSPLYTDICSAGTIHALPITSTPAELRSLLDQVLG